MRVGPPQQATPPEPADDPAAGAVTPAASEAPAMGPDRAAAPSGPMAAWSQMACDAAAEPEETHAHRRAHRHRHPHRHHTHAATTPRAADAPAPPPFDGPSIEELPFDHPEAWPHAVRSAELPIEIHYPEGREDVAKETLAHLEAAWKAHLELGFEPPPLGEGEDAFSVWLWPGAEEAYVAAYDENPATWWDDALTYMVIDPDGPYGGEKLQHTVFHEINHAFQATHDWNEFPSAFEGTATFIEWETGGLNDELTAVARDYQAQPTRGLDRADDGETWFTYGYAMYLRFLKDRHFDGDPGFVAKLWAAARNAPEGNEPDLVDAIEAALPDGVSYADTVLDFARWRYYTGERADGRHDADAAGLPEVATQPAALGRRGETKVDLDPPPEPFGTAYLEVTRGAGSPDAVAVEIDPRQPGMRYVLQVVPGLAGGDGERIEVGADGLATLAFHGETARTLLITPIPEDQAAHDPDLRAETEAEPLAIHFRRPR